MADRTLTQRRNQSVGKAAAILRAAGAAGGDSVSGLARAAGLPRATALRMIEGLVEEGLLTRVGGGDRVVLGPELLRLARSADPAELLLEAARGVLEPLAATLCESVTLTVRRADGSLTIVRQVDGPHMLGLVHWVGRPFPLHASAGGKLALAALTEAQLDAFLRAPLERLAARTISTPEALRRELDRVRASGHAEIVDELEDGLAAVAVPIVVHGTYAGSINVSGPTGRFGRPARARAVRASRAAAEQIAARLA